MTDENQMKLKEVRPTTTRSPTSDNPRARPVAHRLTTIPDLFEDKFEFIDDIHGQVYLNRLERDVVDSPEFQRLFRLSQLGFVDLVYPTANHTRAVHSIGACHLTKGLVERLNQNNEALERKGFAGPKSVPRISNAEKVLISLGGLLHDISHGPFSHDIEKKTHHVVLDEKRRHH